MRVLLLPLPRHPPKIPRSKQNRSMVFSPLDQLAPGPTTTKGQPSASTWRLRPKFPSQLGAALWAFSDWTQWHFGGVNSAPPQSPSMGPGARRGEKRRVLTSILRRLSIDSEMASRDARPHALKPQATDSLKKVLPGDRDVAIRPNRYGHLHGTVLSGNLAILVQCLHRYVECHPSRFHVREREIGTLRVQTIGLVGVDKP